MPSSFNDNNNRDFSEKVKDKKVTRAAVLTVLALAAALIIIITAAIASNRSKEPTKLPEDTSNTQKPSETLPPTEEPTEEPTEKPTEKPTGSTQVGSKIPSFILPVNGSLTNKHDPDIQVFSQTMQDYRVHLGIDLVTKENASVYAAADGKIAKIWKDDFMGYCMAISHSGNCVTVYKNLSEILPAGITEGCSVRAGQLIATVGESAMIEIASEPHLHFEMTVGDLAVDPLEYFSDDSLASIQNDISHE